MASNEFGEGKTFVFIEKYSSYFWKEKDRFLSASDVKEILMLKTEDLHKYRKDKEIPTYGDVMYGFCDKDDYYNLLDKSTILQPSKKSKLAEEIKILISNLGGWNEENINYIHKIILFKYLNSDEVEKHSALVFHGSGGTGKTTFLSLMSTIFGEENVLINLGQPDLDSNFSTYKGRKFVISFEEVSTGDSLAKNISNSNKLKNLIMSAIIHINEKYGKKYSVSNSALVVINSNSDTPIYLDSSSQGNRRYSVFRSDTPLEPVIAKEIQRVIRDKKLVADYLCRLKKTFPEVEKMDSLPAMENKDKEDLVNRCRDHSNEFWDYYYGKGYPTGRVLVTDITDKFSEFCLEFGIMNGNFKKNFWHHSKFGKEKLQYPGTGTPRRVVELPDELEKDN